MYVSSRKKRNILVQPRNGLEVGTISLEKILPLRLNQFCFNKQNLTKHLFHVKHLLAHSGGVVDSYAVTVNGKRDTL